MNPYDITRMFEADLCAYTGAKYAVAVNSGTAAILLACELHWPKSSSAGLFIPARTYVSVPCAIRHAGYHVSFEDIEWSGEYQIKPLPVWDSARRFTSSMYRAGQFQCVSFAAAKILGAEQGGAILHDNVHADRWFRRMRFDGRTEGIDPLHDNFDLVGHHCIMLPSVAALLRVRLHHLPKVNADLPHYEYPDLSKHKAFQ